MISLNKLAAIAAGGFIAVVGMIQAFNYKVSEQLKTTKVYTEALDLLRHHEGALYLLGQPMKDLTASFNSSGYDGKTDLKVPIVGPKTNGILFISCLIDKEGKRSLKSVQLQVGNDDSKRLVIKS